MTAMPHIDTSFKLGPADALTLMETTLACAATDDSRPALMAVQFVTLPDGEFAAYAANGFHAVKAVATGSVGEGELLIDRDSITRAVKVVKSISKKQRDVGTVWFSGRFITIEHYTIGEIAVPARLAEGTFPNLEKILADAHRNDDQLARFAFNAKIMHAIATVANRYCESGIVRCQPPSTPSSPFRLTWTTENLAFEHVIMPMYVRWEDATG